MSLRTNLATRPFYNERAAQAAIIVIAVVVAVATAVNVVRLAALTTRDSALVAEAADAERRTRALRQATAQARSGLDGPRVADVTAAVREANAVIDGRTWSWTALFNWLETNLPPDVRITGVTPRIDQKGAFVLGFTVESESVDGIDRFLGALEATGRFEGLLVREERETDEGTIEATAEGVYKRPAVTAEAAQ
jgi:hypothetical protein